MKLIQISCLFVLTSYVGFSALAQTNSNFTFEGYLTGPDQQPITGIKGFYIELIGNSVAGNVDAGDCVFYTETQSVNVSSGSFVLNIGRGSLPSFLSADVVQISDIFKPGMKYIPNSTSPTCTFNPSSLDAKRFLRVQYYEGSGYINFGKIEITSAPRAMVADSLSGKTENDFVQLQNAAAKIPSLATDPATLVAGMLWFNITSNQLKYYDSVATQTIGAAGSGLTSLNGQTGSTQSFQTGATGLSPQFSSAGNVHTLNIPLASGAGVTSGTISKTDYDAFSNKLTSVVGSSLNNGHLWIGNGSNQATSVAMSGDATLANTGALTLANSGTTAGTYTKVTVDTKGRVTASGVTNITDIKSTVSGNWMTASGTCTPGQTLTYQSVSDTLSCQAYSLTSMQITTALGFTPANGTSYVAKAGDSMTGSLTLPNNGLVVGATQLVVSGGNVGIGTASPGEKLTVSGNISANRLFAPTTGTSGSPAVKITNTHNTGLFSASGTDLSIASGGERSAEFRSVASSVNHPSFAPATTGQPIRLESAGGDANISIALMPKGTGFVGVGATSPATMLDVNGALTLRPFGAATGQTGQIAMRELVANGSNQIILRAPDALASDLNFTLPANFGTSGQVLQTDGSGVLSWVAPSGGGSGTFTTVSAGTGSVASPSLTFTSDPDTGLSNVSPNKITVSTTGAARFEFSDSGLSSIAPGGGVVSAVAGSVAAPTFSFSGDTDTGIYNPAPGIIGFTTNGTEKARIDDQGRLGIGTTTPAQRLTVNASDSTTATPNRAIALYEGTNGRAALGASTNSGSDNVISIETFNSYALRFMPDSIERMRVTTTGNVGIGTKNPSDLFHIYSTSGSVGARIQTATGASYLNLLNTTGAVINNVSNTPMSFMTNNTEKMRIDHLGNVGIGLTNPTYQLQLSTDSAAKPGTGNWTIASDERLKDIRAPFTRGLDAINGLNTIYFNYKRENPLELPSEKEYVGIKAQDAQRVIPESVSTDEQGYLHVTNDSIIWTAVNAIKELYAKFLSHDAQLAQQARLIASKADTAVVDAKVQQLEAKNQKLEQENREMKARLDKIEKMLESK